MTKKKKEKTVQNKGQWITYVVYMLLGAACGIFDLMYMDTAGQSERGLFSDIIPLALMLIGIYAAMLIQLIIHEAGHLIFWPDDRLPLQLLSGRKSDVGKARRPHTMQEAAYRRNRRPMLDDTTRLEGRENAGNAV